MTVEGGRSGLNAFHYDWLLRRCKRTFSPFHCGVVTTYALEVGAAGDGDYRYHSFSAFRAARCSIHEMVLPILGLTTSWNFCSNRACRSRHARGQKGNWGSRPRQLARMRHAAVLPRPTVWRTSNPSNCG
jgi:hypothetical protein